MPSTDDILIGTIYRKMVYGKGEQFLVVLEDHVIPTLTPEDFKTEFGIDITGQDIQGFLPVAILVNPERIK